MGIAPRYGPAAFRVLDALPREINEYSICRSTMGCTVAARCLLYLLDKLDDIPACVISELGETPAQNRLNTLLFGDQSAVTGLDRFLTWRWFTDPEVRLRFNHCAERADARNADRAAVESLG